MQFRYGEVPIPSKPSLELACSGGSLSSTDNDSNEECLCKVLLVECGGSRVSFVSIDALYIGRSLNLEIRSLFEERGIDVYAAATHSHMMPNITREYSFFGQVDEDYLASIINALARLLTEIEEESPSLVTSVGHLECPIPGTHYRRRKIFRPYIDVRRKYTDLKGGWRRSFRVSLSGIVMAPEYRQKIFHMLSSTSLRGGKSNLHIVSNSTHPTNIKTDYSSREIYSYLESQYKARNQQAIFFQGFAGDVKIDFQRTEKARPGDWIRKAIFGPSYGRGTGSSLKKTVDDALKACSLERDGIYIGANTGIKQKRVTAHIGTSLKGKPIMYEFSIIRVEKLVFCIANSEVSNKYYESFTRVLAKSDVLIPISCAGDCVGYLPHFTQLREGGYEDSKFIQYFGFSGEIEENLLLKFITDTEYQLSKI